MIMDEDISGIEDSITFHAHQYIEKLMKAFLLYKNKESERTHKLDLLLEKCAKYDEKLLDFEEQIQTLNDYYIVTRYPDDISEKVTKEEVKIAYNFANEIGKILRDKMGE